jgi:hypothetical protein
VARYRSSSIQLRILPVPPALQGIGTLPAELSL